MRAAASWYRATLNFGEVVRSIVHFVDEGGGSGNRPYLGTCCGMVEHRNFVFKQVPFSLAEAALKGTLMA